MSRTSKVFVVDDERSNVKFGQNYFVPVVIAVLILIQVASKHALEVIMVPLAGLEIAIKGANYTCYAGAIACAALIAADLPQPTNYAAERRPVLFTLIGVLIGLFMMFVADRFQNHSVKTA